MGGGGGGATPLISSGLIYLLSIQCDRRLHSILIAEFDIHWGGEKSYSDMRAYCTG